MPVPESASELGTNFSLSDTETDAGTEMAFVVAPASCRRCLADLGYGTVADHAVVSPDSKPSAYPGVFTQLTSFGVGGRMEGPGPPPALRQITGRARRPS